jgi:hypothetical protein
MDVHLFLQLGGADSLNGVQQTADVLPAPAPQPIPPYLLAVHGHYHACTDDGKQHVDDKDKAWPHTVVQVAEEQTHEQGASKDGHSTFETKLLPSSDQHPLVYG